MDNLISSDFWWLVSTQFNQFLDDLVRKILSETFSYAWDPFPIDVMGFAVVPTRF